MISGLKVSQGFFPLQLKEKASVEFEKFLIGKGGGKIGKKKKTMGKFGIEFKAIMRLLD